MGENGYEEEWLVIYLDKVLLAEEKPEEEEVLLPKPGLGIILIFCNIPGCCCC